MKNNVIIAGVPRAGKSTMSNMLSRKFGYQHVSMDSIIAGFESVFPELGVKWWPSSNDEAENMERFYNASNKVALFIRAMLESGEYDEFEPGMVVDVYQLLPEHYTFDFSDEDMLTHCTFVIERSRFLREQCIKYGLPYYETARDREAVFERFIQSFEENHD